MKVLVLNSGSSSIKYRLYDMSGNRALASGIVERIGESSGRVKHQISGGGQSEVTEVFQPVADHRAGFHAIVEALKQFKLLRSPEELFGIGHRVVHGGARFTAPALVDDSVVAGIRETIPLAPLHNAPNLLGIEIARELFGGVPQVAVFDTAFHHTLPPHAFNYALPRNYAEEFHVRRYGFHGTSFSYVAARAAEFLRRSLESLNLIVLHLGNGASAETSMGMTPLEGLIMGTRCGDLDPAVPFYLLKHAGVSAEELDHVLNEQSGLKGICGANDMREIQRLAEDGNHDAQLAIQMYCHRIKKYIGAYLAVLGRADALIFTAGIGENSTLIRARSCDGLAGLGIELDDEKNLLVVQASQPARIREIQSVHSRVKIMVVPTDEEQEIARHAVEVIKARPGAQT